MFYDSDYVDASKYIFIFEDACLFFCLFKVGIFLQKVNLAKSWRPRSRRKKKRPKISRNV